PHAQTPAVPDKKESRDRDDHLLTITATAPVAVRIEELADTGFLISSLNNTIDLPPLRPDACDEPLKVGDTSHVKECLFERTAFQLGLDNARTGEEAQAIDLLRRLALNRPDSQEAAAIVTRLDTLTGMFRPLSPRLQNGKEESPDNQRTFRYDTRVLLEVNEPRNPVQGTLRSLPEAAQRIGAATFYRVESGGGLLFPVPGRKS
ncbi:MAG: hypothetical protein HQK87_02505, partial [Nitrospinae bacterium]|nr:hypothetical protein [Nitrospinota bacterium]